MLKRRNPYLDILKGVACIAVIVMHWSFTNTARLVLIAVGTRWTMPFFFAISGYFAYNSTLASCKRKTVHILRITICASLIYLIIAILQNIANMGTFLRSELTLKNIGAFVVFNSPVLIEKRLWFLYALLYVYLAFWILTKLDLVKRSYILIPIALIAHFVINYGSRILGDGISAGFVRNWILEGFPCFMFGCWLHENGNHIFTPPPGGDNGTPSYWLLAGIILNGLCAIEYFIFGSASIHIGSVLGAGCFMVFATNANCDASMLQTGVCRKLEWIGRELSLPVYIIHPAVITLFETIFGDPDTLSPLMQWGLLIVIITVTLITAIAYDKAKRNIKIYRESGEQ